MDEFKTQFQPALIRWDHLRINTGYGQKHYLTRFTYGGSRVIHISRKKFKRAEETHSYGNAVMKRYRSLVQAALLEFVESQNVAAD